MTEIKENQKPNILNVEKPVVETPQQKTRVHSYSAGLPKNYVNKMKAQQRNQQKQNQQTKTAKKQTSKKNNVEQTFEIQTKDVNNRTLNSVIGLNKGYKPNKNALKVMFLGGVGEIGKNMMALEYGNDIIIVDCGATFPYAEDMPGIDLVVPDITYLIQNKNKIKGMVITHGHEDHIGAIPYVVGDINVPSSISSTATDILNP